MPSLAAEPGGMNPNDGRIEGVPMTASTDLASGLSVAPTDLIRAGFPALERVYQGHPVAYFDGPGGTQVPQAVVEAMADYLIHHNANTHWAFPTSAETDVA